MQVARICWNGQLEATDAISLKLLVQVASSCQNKLIEDDNTSSLKLLIQEA